MDKGSEQLFVQRRDTNDQCVHQRNANRTLMRYFFTPPGMSIERIMTNISEHMEKLEASYIAGEGVLP